MEHIIIFTVVVVDFILLTKGKVEMSVKNFIGMFLIALICLAPYELYKTHQHEAKQCMCYKTDEKCRTQIQRDRCDYYKETQNET